MREAGKLKQHKEDELGGEVLPQQLARSSDVGVEMFLRLRPLHGVHHQVHQLLLQHRAPLLLLQGVERSVNRAKNKVSTTTRGLTQRDKKYYYNYTKVSHATAVIKHTDLENIFQSLSCRTASYRGPTVALFWRTASPRPFISLRFKRQSWSTDQKIK